MKTFLLWLVTSAVAAVSILRGFVLFSLRLKTIYASALYERIQERGKLFILRQEITDEPLPRNFAALCWLDGIAFHFGVEERMLHAGISGFDVVANVLGFRWQKHRLINIIRGSLKTEDRIPIYIAQPWDAERVGELVIPSPLPVPYLNEAQYATVERDIRNVINRRTDKLGVLLHGDPGNGKSYFVRCMALKYRLPIYIISFTPEMTNHSIIRMFGQFRGPAIVLLEDFDSYFDQRKCLLPEAKFTFDVLLNVLDGVYSSPVGIVFFLTANDLSKIDIALRDRPSRFRYVLPVRIPSPEIVHKIFGSDDHDHLVGKTLDELLSIRDGLVLPGPVESEPIKLQLEVP